MPKEAKLKRAAKENGRKNQGRKYKDEENQIEHQNVRFKS